jgi:hypothetical protein
MTSHWVLARVGAAVCVALVAKGLDAVVVIIARTLSSVAQCVIGIRDSSKT